MVNSLRSILTILLVLAGFGALAQSGGIYGTVKDEKGQPEFGVTIEVSQGGIIKNGAISDADGEYIVKPLDPGAYDVKFSQVGKETMIVQGVIVGGNTDTRLNHKFEVPKGQNIGEVVVRTSRYEKPLISNITDIKTGVEIGRMATRDMGTVVATATQAHQAKEGEGISVAGGRTDGNLVIVDGVVRRGMSTNSMNLPVGTVGQVQIFNSGIPAQFGDAMGGVTSITTRGVAREFQGSLTYERSLEGFGHNLGSFNLSGPIVSKKDKDGNKKPLAGFLLGVEGWYDKDNNPSYVGNWYLKDDVREELEKNPLRQIQTNNGLITTDAGQFITKDGMVHEKARRNAVEKSIRSTGKVDIALSEMAQLTLGGTFNLNNAQNYSRSYSMFSLNNMPAYTAYTAGGYLRYTQRLGRQGVDVNSKEVKSGVTNAYYTIQLDYQKDYSNSEHAVHKRNIFDYNYVGKFRLNETNLYASLVDDSTGLPGVVLVTPRFTGFSNIDFEGSDKNPLFTRYTEQFYEFRNGANVNTLNDIRAGKGLLNGDMPIRINNPSGTNDGFVNIGVAQNGYSYNDNDQFAFKADASFDLVTKSKSRHAIQFGLYYQQRVDRGYSLNSSIAQQNSIWQLMRNTVNSHLNYGGDPIFIVNGKQYSLQDVRNGVISPSPSDTIIYQTQATGLQANFDKNLRNKLGLGADNTSYLNVDEMDPNTFSVDMFSADELLNVGNNFVSYYGYDYKGNKLGNVSFNDYWTKKDQYGNYAREIGAFRPTYIAGYIQDNFRFKDIEFRLGVRVDRYDANTKVMKDPYSLYETYRKGGVDMSKVSIANNNGNQPGNMGDDYVPYVDNNESSRPKIIGYRNGDDWYDASGNLIADPLVLRDVNGGNPIYPYLTDAGKSSRITDSTFNPDNSFEDYKPQVNVSPRIAFRFPIADQTAFFAHYDVMVQRPTGRVNLTPDRYYYFAQIAADTRNSPLNNPNLKPQKMFDYEFGFQQALSKNVAITLTGFYRERKDMIQMVQLYQAWPVTYYSYGNRDFSTTKGMTLKFDRRRKNNLEFQVNYTLQFADGTGSNDRSAGGFISSVIAAGLPNLRWTAPLNIDSRHNLNILADYRYGNNEGPEIAGAKVFQNAGINLLFKARSGEPYTAYAEPKISTVKGSAFGSRLPWHYMFDLKVDKSFTLKKPTETSKREIGLNIFAYVQNLFNQRDVLGVYGYTSRPDDDGYLTHPRGIQEMSSLYDGQAQSYMDMYSIIYNTPGNYNLPRRINVGLSINF